MTVSVVIPAFEAEATVGAAISSALWQTYRDFEVVVVEDGSRDEYRRIAAALVAQGAQGLIFGCTEIMMLLGQHDVSVPAFDTTELHALGAVERALPPAEQTITRSAGADAPPW